MCRKTIILCGTRSATHVFQPGVTVFQFILYSVIGYFLIGLNNAFAIIRMRASVQTGIYFLLISVCPSLHVLYAGDLAAIAFLIALFSCSRAISIPSLPVIFPHIHIHRNRQSAFPQLTYFAPIFWIGAYNFQSLHTKSFFASLVGWSLPYWFLLGYAYTSGQMDLFYRPFLELVNFHPVRFNFQPWELATSGYLLLYI